MGMDIDSLIAPNMRILIVLDTPVNIAMFKGLLKHTQIEIDVAKSGQECLACAAKTQYHVIFADMQLPDMDGEQLLRHIKEDGDSLNQKTPVIAMGTDDIEPDKQGFSGYLEFPMDGKYLRELVMQYLPNRKSDGGCDGNKVENTADDLMTQISKIEGIDIETGIQACATEEIYLSVVKEFYPPAEKQAGLIEEYCNEKDYKNYTISVHSLKSAARLIGATALSEQARMLEMCGYTMQEGVSVSENAQEQALTSIQSVTPKLLQTYRLYADLLRDIFEPKDEEKAKPLIDEKMLREALEALRELVEGFDYDSADSVMDTLAKYRMPDDFQKNFQELKSLMAEVARDDIIKEINAYFSREEH